MCCCWARADAGRRLPDPLDGAPDSGVMISASHNPYEDNGIKLFGPDGFKLSMQSRT